jgi:hypothetical protein
MADRAVLERLSRALADQGRLIEAGFVGMRLACDLQDAPADQLRELRMAFFGGAQHLFSSIMTILEPGEDGEEPTDKDLERMSLISAELDAFIKEFERQSISRSSSGRRGVETPVGTEVGANAKDERAPVIKQTLGDKPIERQYRDVMNDMAKFIDAAFNGPVKGHKRKTGFVLMAFAFGGEGRCNYISNARREDVVVALKEQLARFEGSPDVTGHA